MASLEEVELIRSDKFDLGEEDLETLDQRLYLALRYLEIPEWWHLLGSNSPAGRIISIQTLVQYNLRLILPIHFSMFAC